MKKRTTEAAEREKSEKIDPVDCEGIRTENEAVVREEWLEWRAVRQHLAVDTLSLESGVEASRREADSPPGEETADRGHLLESL